MDSYFFVRYVELGPHIRVRVRVPHAHCAVVEALLEEVLWERFPARLLSQSAGRIPRGGRRTQHTALVWIPYVPEIRRYGGPQGVEVAESFFRDSTDVSFQLLEGIGSGRLDREGIGLAAMIAFLGSMIHEVGCAATTARLVRDWNAPRDLEEVFEQGFSDQAETLTAQIAEVWAATVDGGLPSPLDAYAAAAQNARGRLDQLVRVRQLTSPAGTPVMSLNEAVRMLAPSYMHMTNNRLGLTNITEAFLGHATWHVLRGFRAMGPRPEDLRP